MKRRLPLVLVLVAALTLVFSAVANATLSTSYVFNGHGGYSADGLGQNGPGGILQGRGARRARRCRRRSSTARTTSSPILTSPQRTIDFDGTMVVTTNDRRRQQPRDDARRRDRPGRCQGRRRRRDHDVHDRQRPERTQRPRTRRRLRQPRPSPENTIARARRCGIEGRRHGDVRASRRRSTRRCRASRRRCRSAAATRYQGVGRACLRPVGQFSIVDVNSQRLTSCAGNFDDGLGNDGALVTVGGVGDLTDNPVGSATSPDRRRRRALQPLAVPGAGCDEHRGQDVEPVPGRRPVPRRRSRSPRGRRSRTRICNDGIDNDGDGLIDAADPDCAPPPTEQVRHHPGQRRPARERAGEVRVRDPLQAGRSCAHRQPLVQRQGDADAVRLDLDLDLASSGDDATASGSGVANGLPVSFTLTIHNKPDSFSIQLSNGYSATWTPKTGRIEIHASARQRLLPAETGGPGRAGRAHLDSDDGDVAARRRAAPPPGVDEGSRAERRRTLLRRQEAAARRSRCTPSARRRAARTSPSAGVAAPRPSRSSATRAPAPAATATSTPASPSTRPIRSSRSGSARRPRRWS